MAAARRVAGGGGGSLWGPPQPPPSTGGGIPQLPAAAAAPVEGLLDAPFSSSSGGGGGGWPPPPPPLSGTAVLIGYPQGNFETFPQQDLVPLTAQEVHSKCITFGRAENLSFIPLATSALVSQHTGSSSVNVTPLQEILTSPSQISNVNTESIGVLQGLPASSIVLDRPTDDGYNWRKYGQKAVKGGEYPKSYYKCTHLNCLVRKNVEHSADGRIVQIIYRGQHTHERPSKRRFKDCGGISDDLDDFSGTTGTSVRSQPDYDDYCRKPIIPSGTMVAPLVKKIEDGDDQLSGSSDNQDEHDDEVRTADGASGDASANEGNVPAPGQKIIVSTTSEIDLLDDGYRWRKYGQKVVKGNPYPRSYYKCTYLGCDVKKQVERSVEEPNAVITTYEGKHIHDVPAARNKSHVVANASLLQNTKSNTYCTEQSYTTITC
ncbi:probable WRKY transcription factor 3 isoform X1 [Oryza glaberrima]|uniref:WRKY domain-containing protein n=1 Tax=Oryza glaberrima TaxID=4538 RepID=I1QBW7_ORYGL|nr:probable WRKY transcription factor 3 isoform X1 [Oryza glaberrima]